MPPGAWKTALDKLSGNYKYWMKNEYGQPKLLKQYGDLPKPFLAFLRALRNGEREQTLPGVAAFLNRHYERRRREEDDAAEAAKAAEEAKAAEAAKAAEEAKAAEGGEAAGAPAKEEGEAAGAPAKRPRTE